MGTSKQRIEILGVYRYVPDAATLRRQATLSPEPSAARRMAQAKRELSKAVLVEVLAHHTRRSFKAKFGQPGEAMNSFDWNQRQLTLDGTSQMGYDPAGKEIVRLAFFIHAYDPRKPVKTDSGPLTPPPVLPMPPRLAKAMPYDVCD